MMGQYAQIKAVEGMVNRYGGPMGLAGKLIGLGKDEIDAGIPGWSWFTLGMMAGGIVTYHLRGKIEKVAGD